MKSLALAAFLVLSGGAFAESIHSIVRGSGNEPHLIKFQSGAVVFVEQHEKEKLQKFEEELALTMSFEESSSEQKNLLEEETYEPTVVPDDQIPAIFSRMNPYIKRKSECTDRAHVWAYDEFQRSGIKLQKAFLFLTNSYIIRNRYKWWFHVAPLYTTASGQKIVMDYQFIDHPAPFSEWKNNLVFSKRECVTDFRFLDYNAGADQTQDCYTKFVPMYYRIPADIGSLEQGSARTGWNSFEVNQSRSRAFFKGSL